MKKILLSCSVALAVFFASAQTSHPYYGGSHHTTSHGGTYAGGSGSSHKGGHYVNARTNNTYGRHKKG